MSSLSGGGYLGCTALDSRMTNMSFTGSHHMDTPCTRNHIGDRLYVITACVITIVIVIVIATVIVTVAVNVIVIVIVIVPEIMIAPPGHALHTQPHQRSI